MVSKDSCLVVVKVKRLVEIKKEGNYWENKEVYDGFVSGLDKNFLIFCWRFNVVDKDKMLFILGKDF